MGQPLKDSGSSHIKFPFVSNMSRVSFLIQGNPPFETRRRLRKGLHGYRMVRLELNDPKILLVGLADLLVGGSDAYWALRELPYLQNVVVLPRNVPEI
jgi:hypothetical protein